MDFRLCVASAMDANFGGTITMAVLKARRTRFIQASEERYGDPLICWWSNVALGSDEAHQGLGEPWSNTDVDQRECGDEILKLAPWHQGGESLGMVERCASQEVEAHEPPTRTEDPGRLPNRLSPVTGVVKHEKREDEIEAVVGKRQPIGVCLFDDHPRPVATQAPGSDRAHVRIEVRDDHMKIRRDREQMVRHGPDPGTDLEDLPVGMGALQCPGCDETGGQKAVGTGRHDQALVAAHRHRVAHVSPIVPFIQPPQLACPLQLPGCEVIHLTMAVHHSVGVVAAPLGGLAVIQSSQVASMRSGPPHIIWGPT
jgi:hypothetical protein